MVPVLFPVGCVDHQQVDILVKTVQIGIINGISVFIRDNGVLTLAHFKSTGIISQYLLEKWQGILPADDKTSHMRHIKESSTLPGNQMLLKHPFCILYRHVPTAEIHHCGIQFPVIVIKKSLV